MSVFGEFHGLNALYSFQLSVLWPFLPIASGLVSRDKRTVLCQTAQWAEGRRAMHYLINGAALTYGEWQELESAQLLAAYLLQPALWHKHHFRHPNSVMHWVVLSSRHLKPTLELAPYSPSRSSSSAASTPAPSTSSRSSRGYRARYSSGLPTESHGESALQRLPHVVGPGPKRRRGWDHPAVFRARCLAAS